MPQFSLFTHGTALAVETPGNLAGHTRFGWGTDVFFREPVRQVVNGLPVFDEVGPGSWLHLPLPMTHTTFGRKTPRLESVTLLFETTHCRITSVHVWDGANRVQAFDGLRLRGAFLDRRDPEDVNPEAPPSATPQTFANTLRLRRPHPVFSAVGISFFACAFFEDFNRQGRAHNPEFDGPFPTSMLRVAGGGAQLAIPGDPVVGLTVGRMRITLDP
jgi:hypothetical protein